MLYRLVRPVARYVLGYYFRNIDITGLEHIPRGKAVILAANHPTAFLEPCMLACFQNRSLHFLARGDLYKNRLATTLLRALHILPVYRMQDGTYADLSRNYSTFDECAAVLSKNKALMILAEGRCIHEKRLRPLRKGTARVAMGALDKDSTLEEVYVVPVGVNFTAAERIRSRVMIRCGAPLLASNYLSSYRQNEAVCLKEFTAALHEKINPLVVQLPARESDDAYGLQLKIIENDVSFQEGGITHSGKLLDILLATTENLPNDQAGLRTYAARLHLNGVNDHQVSNQLRSRPSVFKAVVAALLIVPQLPLWLLAQLIATTLPKTVEFYSPVRFAVVAVGTILYVPLLLLIAWPAKIYLIVSVLLTGWSIRQIEPLVAWRDRQKFDRLVPEEKEILGSLRRQLVD